MVDDSGRHDTVQEWVTLPEAARLAQVSERTMRRRVQTGLVESRVDPDDGRGRYLIRASSVVAPDPGTQLIPVALLDRLEALRSELQAEAVQRARAEEIARFQTERATAETDRRREIEAERDRLATEVADLRARKWWQRRTVR